MVYTQRCDFEILVSCLREQNCSAITNIGAKQLTAVEQNATHCRTTKLAVEINFHEILVNTYKCLSEICRNPLVKCFVICIKSLILLDKRRHPLSQRIFDIVRRPMTIDTMAIRNSEKMDPLRRTEIWRQCVTVLVNFAWVLWLVPARCCKCKLGYYILSALTYYLFVWILPDKVCCNSHFILRSLLH